MMIEIPSLFDEQHLKSAVKIKRRGAKRFIEEIRLLNEEVNRLKSELKEERNRRISAEAAASLLLASLNDSK